MDRYDDTLVERSMFIRKYINVKPTDKWNWLNYMSTADNNIIMFCCEKKRHQSGWAIWYIENLIGNNIIVSSLGMNIMREFIRRNLFSRI